MRAIFFPILIFAVITGIQPVIAQDSGTASGTDTLDLELASDDELSRALDKAGDIELINKEDNAAEKTDEEPPAKDVGFGNDYLLESRRLARLAEEAFSKGDYDASARFADEAALLALRSDVKVAVTEAKRRLDLAVASGASARFPKEFGEVENRYKQSINARDNEEWDAAIEAAKMTVKLLEGIGDPRNSALAPLPAAYTVRPWSVSKDCFWNIAGFQWVYGNPRQWRVLYNANKSKLPNPNNPDVLKPGTVLVIPSIKGEQRTGEWDGGKTYESFR